MSLMQSSWRQSLAGLAVLAITSTALANQEDGDPPKKAPPVASEEHEDGERAKSRAVDRAAAPREREVRRERGGDAAPREFLRERERTETRERRSERVSRSKGRESDRGNRPSYDPREPRDTRERDRDRPPERHEDEREGTERRLQQILEASEKLQQAGFDEDAKNLRRLADELREHFLRRDEGREERGQRERDQTDRERSVEERRLVRPGGFEQPYSPSEYRRERSERFTPLIRLPRDIGPRSGTQPGMETPLSRLSRAQVANLPMRPSQPQLPNLPARRVNQPAGPEGNSNAVLDMLREMRHELAGFRKEMNDLRSKVDGPKRKKYTESFEMFDSDRSRETTR